MMNLSFLHAIVPTTMDQRKKPTKNHEKLPAKKTEVTLWHAVCACLVGPCTVETDQGDIALYCLTIVDPVTHWVELVEIPNKIAEESALQFDRFWLSRCARSNCIMFGKESEFV